MIPGATEEEEDLVFDYIYANYLIHVLERDLKHVSAANFKISEVYVNLIEETLKRLRLDLKRMKDEMKNKGMKVGDPERDDIIIQYEYWIRGRHGIKRMWDAHMRNEAQKQIWKYLSPRS